MEDSHLPLSKWVKAFHMMCASKKGISALQLQRNLGLGSYRTAWHLGHRIRFAMTNGPFPLKGIVEVDQTYIGGKPRPGAPRGKRGRGTEKTAVIVLVERDGKAHCKPVERVDSKTLNGAIREMIDPTSTICIDEMKAYQGTEWTSTAGT
jgi:hypothetical protein